MHGEDLLVDDGRDWQTVEAVCECFPQFNVVPSFAFVVEAIDAVDRSAFVIPTEDEKIFRVFDLVGKQQTDRFEGLLASVYVVTQKQVIRLGRETAVLKET